MSQELNIIHQSQIFSKTNNGRSNRISYSGTETEIDSKMNSLKIGVFYSEFKGYLTLMEKSQLGGELWKLDLEFSVDYAGGSGGSDETPETQEPPWSQRKTAQLSVRNLQLPLERLDNYLMNWNHFLIGKDDASTPAWWETAKKNSISDSDQKKFKWIKSESEIPESAEGEKGWKVLEKPTKLGVEYYDFAVFVVTESVRYKSQSEAGNAVKRTINTITAPENDFGLSGGNWKHDESNISWDGQFWLATNVYTFSGDEKGWDTDIYRRG